MKKRIVVGISGASGSLYALALIKALLSPGIEVHLIISEMGARVLSHELKIETDHIHEVICGMNSEIIIHDCNNMFAPVASGSYPVSAMVIIPCSMKSLANIAGGHSGNLIERSADVCLKERQPLILVTRETPLNRIHIKNMLAAHDAGATIMPASPGFYHHPQDMDDLAEYITARVLDHLGIEHVTSSRWEGS